VETAVNGKSAPQSDKDKAVVKKLVEVWPDQTKILDQVADEVAVALVYNDVSHAVMMATPLDLEEFAVGFTLTEGIVENANDVYDIQINRLDEGIEVALTISSQCFTKLKDRRRSMTGRTGCGICGAESLQQVRIPVVAVNSDFSVTHAAIDYATRTLADCQPLQVLTGATHGAAWCDSTGSIVQVCEDVGRHNALDKLIGRLAQMGVIKSGHEMQGFLLISSRASYEMVQKSAMANIGIVVAVSAATSMAVDIANSAGITLVGFSREGRHVAYTNSQRLIE
jgi:formate dehydrogenase accessory protein FdhD